MIWSSNYVTRISHLVTLQKEAIRIITKSSYNSHTSHMFRKHSILKVDQIKIYQTSEFMFRFNRGQLPKAFPNYFEVVSQVHSHYTRRVNDYKVDFVRTNTRRFSMKITSPNIWNDLPADICGVSNMYSFKRLLRAYLTNSIAIK